MVCWLNLVLCADSGGGKPMPREIDENNDLTIDDRIEKMETCHIERSIFNLSFDQDETIFKVKSRMKHLIRLKLLQTSLMEMNISYGIGQIQWNNTRWIL